MLKHSLVDRILEIRGLRPFTNVSGSSSKEPGANPGPAQVQELGEIENDQESSQAANCGEVLGLECGR